MWSTKLARNFASLGLLFVQKSFYLSELISVRFEEQEEANESIDYLIKNSIYLFYILSLS